MKNKNIKLIICVYFYILFLVNKKSNEFNFEAKKYLFLSKMKLLQSENVIKQITKETKYSQINLLLIIKQKFILF